MKSHMKEQQEGMKKIKMITALHCFVLHLQAVYEMLNVIGCCISKSKGSK
jgi:hypothetical protein